MALKLMQMLLHVLVFLIRALFYYLPRTPRFLWKRAKEPGKSYRHMVESYYFTYTIALPYLCYEIRRDMHERVERYYWGAYENAKDARRNRLRKHRRSLTPMGFRMPPQECSLFLSRLPSELRIMIYKMYFDDHKLLVTLVRRHFWTKLISLPLDSKFVQADRESKSETLFTRGIQGGLLDLSLTCKQIYAETINILYARSTFCFTQGAQLTPFQLHILPQRWHAITSIEYSPDIHVVLQGQLLALKRKPCHLHPAHDREWPLFSATIESIRDLERVVIVDAYLGDKLQLLHELLAFKSDLRTFEVYLTPNQPLSNEFRTKLENAQLKLILPNGQSFTHDPWVERRSAEGYTARAYEFSHGWCPYPGF